MGFPKTFGKAMAAIYGQQEPRQTHWEIDTKGDPNWHSQWAREIWQVLFRETEAHRWPCLNDFLIDLGGFEEQVSKRSARFYWTWVPETGCTFVTEYKPYEAAFRITKEGSIIGIDYCWSENQPCP